MTRGFTARILTVTGMASLLVAPTMGQPPSEAPPLLPAPVAPDQKLTFEQALAIGAKQSPVVGAAEHTSLEARHNLSGQKQPLNPSFTFAAVNNSFVPLQGNQLTNPS